MKIPASVVAESKTSDGGGLYRFHVKDLHGLRDHGAGVDLAVDPHYEGLVEQDVCVFCREGRQRVTQRLLGTRHCYRRGPDLDTGERIRAGS